MSASTSSPRPRDRERTVFSGAFEMIGACELPERPTTTAGEPYDEARLLIRIAGEPVGFVTVPLDDGVLSKAAVERAIERDLATSVEAEMARQGRHGGPALSVEAIERVRPRLTSTLVPALTVTVVVCTRNRADALLDCLRSLQGLQHDELDFMIVDNAPADESTYELVTRIGEEDPRFKYVREPLPGLARARNCGVAHADGEIIAFTDDDVRVDSLWIRALLRGFGRRASVGCVTGMVASASLERPAEQYFDGRVWWSAKCEPVVYDADRGPLTKGLHPYAAGAMGTGANFAVRAKLLKEIGVFDECLGAGSPCEGGEDLDIFVRFIRAGYAISYEPAALVWHEHRAGADELARQMYSYGKSLSAYLFKYATSRRSALDILKRLPHGARHLMLLAGRSRQMESQTSLAYEPVLAELRGLAVGPLAYYRARRAQDPERRRAVAP